MHLFLAFSLALSVALAHQEHLDRTKRLCSCLDLTANPCTCQPGLSARCTCVKPAFQRSCACPVKKQFSQCRNACQRTCSLACARSTFIPACPSSCSSSCSQSCLDQFAVPIHVVLPKVVTVRQCIPVCQQSCENSCGGVLSNEKCGRLCQLPCEQKCSQIVPVVAHQQAVTKTVTNSPVLATSQCLPACRPICDPKCTSNDPLQGRKQETQQWTQSLVPSKAHPSVVSGARGSLSDTDYSAMDKTQLLNPSANQFGSDLLKEPLFADVSQLPSNQQGPYLEAPNQQYSQTANLVQEPEALLGSQSVSSHLVDAAISSNSPNPSMPVRKEQYVEEGSKLPHIVESPRITSEDGTHPQSFFVDEQGRTFFSPSTESPQALQMLTERYGEASKENLPASIQSIPDIQGVGNGLHHPAIHPEIAGERNQNGLYLSLPASNTPDPKIVTEEAHELHQTATVPQLLHNPSLFDASQFKNLSVTKDNLVKTGSSDNAVGLQVSKEAPQILTSNGAAVPIPTQIAAADPLPNSNSVIFGVPYDKQQVQVLSPNAKERPSHQESVGPTGDQTNFKCPVACLPTCEPQCVHEQQLLRNQSSEGISAGISTKTQELEKKIRELESALKKAKADDVTRAHRLSKNVPERAALA